MAIRRWWHCAALAALALTSSSARGDSYLREVLLSRQLAEASGLRVGDLARLAVHPSGSDAREFHVAGIYEPQPDPMKLTDRRFEARLHLGDFIALTADPLDPQAGETISALHVALRDPSDAERFARAFTARMPGTVALPTAAPREGDPFAVLERFHAAIAVVTVAGSAAFLLALMVMRADERREIVGILRILGFSRGRILLDVLLEGAILAAVGAVFGVLFAAATEGIVNRFFQWRYDTPLVFVRITPSIALQSVAFAIPLGVSAGLLAAWSLLRLRIVSLLRR